MNFSVELRSAYPCAFAQLGHIEIIVFQSVLKNRHYAVDKSFVFGSSYLKVSLCRWLRMLMNARRYHDITIFASMRKPTSKLKRITKKFIVPCNRFSGIQNNSIFKPDHF